MKTRWKILIGLGVVLVVLFCAAYLTMHTKPSKAVDAYREILRAKGEKLDLKEILPAPVPPESNSVVAVEEAFGKFVSSGAFLPHSMKMIANGKALVTWKQPVVHGDRGGESTTNSWKEFMAEVATERPAFELLHQVLERPQLQFQLDYSKGAFLLLPHLAPMKRSVQRLQAAIVCDLHSGDSGAAATNILTMLGLCHRNTREGLLISHLVRIAIVSIAVAPTWSLLQSPAVTDAQLARLQQGWEQVDFLKDAENAFTTERVMMTMTIQQVRASSEEFDKMLGTGLGATGYSGGSSSRSFWSWPPDWESMTESTRESIGKNLWRSSWSYADELDTLKNNQIILETLRAMQTNRSHHYKAEYDVMTNRLSSLVPPRSHSGIIRALKIPDYGGILGFGDGLRNTVGKTLRIATTRSIVVTAIALKRFQLQHGKLPAALTDLVPQFLTTVPIDPMDGKPVKYRPNADGTYLLYSIGEDGVDDGGDSRNPSTSSKSLDWGRGRDWVWPQPATAAEEKDYFDALAAEAAAKAASGLLPDTPPGMGLPPPPGARMRMVPTP